MEKKPYEFWVAQPVWLKGLACEMNITAGLRSCIRVAEFQEARLKLAVSGVYRLYINGKFIGHGPAVASHGYYRMDEYDIGKYLVTGGNIVAIEAVGYNVNSFYTLDQPSFVQAEILIDQEVVSATGIDGNSFETGILMERIQKVQRYSFQRPFAEAYRLGPGYTDWRNNENEVFNRTPWELAEPKNLLPRRVRYPDFKIAKPCQYVSEGLIQTAARGMHRWKDRSIMDIGPQLKGFAEHELELCLSDEAMRIEILSYKHTYQSYDAYPEIDLKQDEYRIVEFAENMTGFPGCHLICDRVTRILFLFDEILTEGKVDFKRNASVNVISCEMMPGAYRFESMEPYTLKYLQIVVLEGKCRISDIYLRNYTNPDVEKAIFTCNDERLNQIFEAGRNTFQQNAVDSFLDCPSRERGGWLCDSFFTARVANDLSGNTLVEENFLENYLLADEYPYIPEGMLPMCYPADHYDEVYIPQWSLWFIIQLEEYARRTKVQQLVWQFEKKILRLFDFLKQYVNEYGLLEKLDGWQFIEWSKANDFVNDVNYPTNMLYAAALWAAGSLYEKDELIQQAAVVREVVLAQSFNGLYFRDNAIRIDGVLVPQENYTEVCQYYAYFFKIIPENVREQLSDNLAEKFGPSGNEKSELSNVYRANAFIGYYLRFEMLSADNRNEQIVKELCDYFYDMAKKTGTLWEHKNQTGSLNHGFASHVVHIIYRDILGIKAVDVAEKIVYLQFNDIELEECKGVMPVPDGIISIEWKRAGAYIRYTCKVPEGYRLSIKNRSGKSIISSDSGLH